MMAKEISPWTFIINALYAVKDRPPLSLNPKDERYFWKYTFSASKKLNEKFSNIARYINRTNLEWAIYNDGLGINLQDDKISIDEGLNIQNINEYFDSEIKEKMPNIFRQAYQETFG